MTETVGQRLRIARQDHRLSIEQAADATRIRPHYLQALEADDYSVMPSVVQARGFLRNYAAFLDLDLQAILAELQAAQPVEQVSGPLPQVDLAPAAPEAAAAPPVQEEPVRPPFWQSWLGRGRKPAPEPEPVPVLVEVAPVPMKESQPAPAEEEIPLAPPVMIEETPAVIEPPSKPRGRKKKAETLPENPPVTQEPLTRKRRSTKKATEEIPAVQEPATRVRRKKKLEETPVSPVERAVEPPQPEVIESASLEQEAVTQLEVEALPVEAEQAQGGSQGPSLLSRLGTVIRSMFPLRVAKTQDVEEVVTTESLEEPEAIPTPAPDPQPQAQVPGVRETPEFIFREIGMELRNRRELLSLTLEEVERHTHLREVFARALEGGDFDQLPSTVQARGMLTTYATFLDLNTDALLLRYADALQARHRARYPEKTGGERPPTEVRSTLPSWRSFMAGDLIFGLITLVSITLLAGWGLTRFFAQQAEQVDLPPVPSISESLAETPLPTLVQEVTLIPPVDTPFALAETGTPEGATPEVPTPNLNVSVFLNIVVTERTFMRVLVDGAEVFNGRVVPGSVYPYEAAQSVQVLTGNGAALRVTYNGRDMGLLGNFGEVVNYIYSVDSIVTPTPPSSPTASATPNVTSTPSPTPTRTPTPAPTSTPQN